MASDLLAGLNAQQQEAVTTGPGPVIVYAGPGSGKTRVLTHRLAYLVGEMGVYPGAIMAVTFTNKAASEMRIRAEGLLGGHLRGIQIGTFHAICARLLRREAQHTPYRSDYLIYDTDDQLAVVGQAMNELNIDSKRFSARSILNAISNAKNELITADSCTGLNYFGEIVARVYQAYQEILVANSALDFDDLLMQTVLLMRENDEVHEKYQRFYEYILVDEFQDTNMAQYTLVQMLGKPQNNIFVVGDEDQGIYAFRGADYRNVMQFRQDYPQARMIILEQNYRSTQIVLDAARAVIQKNPHRQDKSLFTERRGGTKIYLYEAYDQNEEGEFIAQKVEELRHHERLDYRNFAVMYRTNAQSRALEESFIRENVPYKLVGGVSFYKRREVRDLLAYLRLVNNPDDTVSFNRVINVPKRSIGKKSVADFQNWAGQMHYSYGGALQALVDGEVSPLSTRATAAFIEFGKMLDGWRHTADTDNLTELFDRIMGQTQYRIYLQEISDTRDQVIERDENLRELRGQLEMADATETPLNEFLAQTALVADVDTLQEDADAVTLLTLHSAKGLEYPIVFIAGMEEGVLPHTRSMDDPEEMAEERRLMYVGLTRAKDQVYLTYAFRRFLYGNSEANVPSRFLGDIPVELVDGMVSSSSASRRESYSYQRETTWDQSTFGTGRKKIITFPSAEPELQFKTGMRVQHARFGEGTVIESKRSGSDEEVTVSFKMVGIKRLAASYAGLKVLSKG
ncbi:MAG: UvrD-helicase domain-containing protein [Anaerolineae bacterium]|nr:UvrD-helicase domain-containing protein [Anaerolineae bacterium]